MQQNGRDAFFRWLEHVTTAHTGNSVCSVWPPWSERCLCYGAVYWQWVGVSCVFFWMIRRPARATGFPYATLRRPGPRHPDTLAAMGNLASMLSQQGKLEDAEAMERETLEARRDVLGPCHMRKFAQIFQKVRTLPFTIILMSKPLRSERPHFSSIIIYLYIYS